MICNSRPCAMSVAPSCDVGEGNSTQSKTTWGLPSSVEEGWRAERRGGCRKVSPIVAQLIPVLAAATVQLTELTTPLLRAPPLLNQEGSSMPLLQGALA